VSEGTPASGIRTLPENAADWTAADTAEYYRVDVWGDGFFFIDDEGYAALRPEQDSEVAIRIADVVADLADRGVQPPVLLRFQDVLRSRVRRINEAFRRAIERYEYEGEYRSVYPIKVNQLHEVVEEVLDAGEPYGLGLECGSKPELVATLPHLTRDDRLLICNGVKDDAMLSLIHAGQRLGKRVIPVVEKFGEFEQWMALTADSDTVAEFGVRVRLTTGGAGRWAESGGDRSKFGVSVPELVELLERLNADGRQDAFVLLHFHVGSQVSDVQVLRNAVKEITQIYAKLVRRGIGIRYIDVGGGLGVRYDDGEGTGITYSLQEYANAVVSAVHDVCEDQSLPHPTLISESGRAITAHHSVLIVESLGAYTKNMIDEEFRPGDEHHALVRKLYRVLERLRKRGRRGSASPALLIEAYHECRDVRRDAEASFRLGYMPLEQQALIERLFWSACAVIAEGLREADLDPPPAELGTIEEALVDQHLCDFSVFQSILDHWAIGQTFPLMPIARLDERPDRRAVLVDLTCDSDGKIHHYVTANADKTYVALHGMRPGERYFIGLFLMGAYQDIMGDAHNLFGRVAEAHVYADPDEPGSFWVEKIIPGTRVQEILGQVQYFANDLERRMSELVRDKINAGVLRPKQGMQILEEYLRTFPRSTYVEHDRQ
jgi:arginine decarboxylase